MSMCVCHPSSVQGQRNGYLSIFPTLGPQRASETNTSTAEQSSRTLHATAHPSHAILYFDVPMTTDMTAAHRGNPSHTAKGHKSEIIEDATPTIWAR
ncbi:hypothetical protein LY76DRAFT_165522 [Colletotrichum caudatum]|nr:hypothetical protein LY76DRAFT_165522 [Colletotrichum caudatum]